ncbi:MAG: iron-sulfur cluster assembly protein [Candidatus Binatota bacterium]|jgi:iron-sulfur cluster assembly accessory protein|nr:iron-sulfur cluster assembly protein [Candidatus Binatota bacterium]
MPEPAIHDHAATHEPAVDDGAAPVVLTGSAVEKMKEVIRKENLSGETGVRFAVTGGGCSGFSYGMSFESEARADDSICEQDGIKIYIDAASLPYLAGTTVDYATSLHREGFKFLNPKASRTCGCGESFGV